MKFWSPSQPLKLLPSSLGCLQVNTLLACLDLGFLRNRGIGIGKTSVRPVWFLRLFLLKKHFLGWAGSEYYFGEEFQPRIE